MMYASSSYGDPWQISMRSSTIVGPSGRSASHARYAGRERVERPARRDFRDGVEAFGLFQPARHLVVIAANNGRRLERLHAFDHRIRIGAVADEIAEHQRALVPARLSLGQARVQRFEIRVDVGENEIAQRGGILLRFEPIHQLLDERIDARAAGVEPDVRERVRGTARVVQPLELGAVGGEGAPAVDRQAVDDAIERRVEPHRHAVAIDGGAVLRVDERAAAGGDDQVPRLELRDEDRAFG